MSYDPDLCRRVLFGPPAEEIDLRPLFRGLLKEKPAMTDDTPPLDLSWSAWHARQEARLDADLLEPSVPGGDPEQEADARDWLQREFPTEEAAEEVGWFIDLGRFLSAWGLALYWSCVAGFVVGGAGVLLGWWRP